MANFYTDEYYRNLPPDGNVPAGMVLCSGTRYVAPTGDLAQNSVIHMCRIPKNAVILDVLLSWSEPNGSQTFQVGTSAGVDSILNAVTATALGAMSLSGGQQGTTAVATGLKAASSIRRGYKFTAADYLTIKNTGAAMVADEVVEAYVLYFMDHGSDLETDAG